LVTHDQSEALSFADQVAVMFAGRFAQVDTPADLYSKPATPAIGQFLGDAMLLDGHATGLTVDCVLGRITLAEPAIGAVLVMLRPEQLQLHEPGGTIARVTSVSYHGPHAIVQLEVPDQTTRLVARVPCDQVPQVAEKVTVTVPAPVRSFPRSS
jgi:iron(III) transport system ATP-binding protein